MLFEILAVIAGLPGQLGFRVMFLAALTLPLVALIRLCVCILLVVTRHWRQSLSVVVAPFVVLAVRWPIVVGADYVHLLIDWNAIQPLLHLRHRVASVAWVKPHRR